MAAKKTRKKLMKKAKVFCPSCKKTAVPQVRGYHMWCGSCGDPID